MYIQYMHTSHNVLELGQLYNFSLYKVMTLQCRLIATLTKHYKNTSVKLSRYCSSQIVQLNTLLNAVLIC